MEKHLKMCKYKYIFKIHFLLFVLCIYSILTNGFLIYIDTHFILKVLNTLTGLHCLKDSLYESVLFYM